MLRRLALELERYVLLSCTALPSILHFVHTYRSLDESSRSDFFLDNLDSRVTLSLRLLQRYREIIIAQSIHSIGIALILYCSL
jgi:hypothetical protein